MKSKVTMSLLDGDGSGLFDRDVSVTISESETIQTLVEAFTAFALVAGYHKMTIVDAMADFVDANAGIGDEPRFEEVSLGGPKSAANPEL